jgi:ketosteroid isomerase-like protein
MDQGLQRWQHQGHRRPRGSRCARPAVQDNTSKATGTSITYNEIFICRFANGQIAEVWGIVDVFSQMRQLGLLGGS